MIAFLIFAGCAKNEDTSTVKSDVNQLKAVPENGTVSWNYTGGYYAADLICDDMVIDLLEGDVDWHVRDHYKNGDLVWSIYNASGSLTVASTGETFEIQESDKFYWSLGESSFHCNLVGDQGTHFILFGHYDLITWEISIDKATCPGQ